MTKRHLFPIVTLWSLVLLLAAQLHPLAQGRGGAPVSLPDGAGKDLVQATCSKCHSLALLTGGFGYTRADWEKVVGSMVALPQGDRETVLTYLATNFPEKNRPKSVIVPGKAQVSFKEWIVPTLGSRPHDPLATPDGAIWWTGQWANVLGRVDPRNGDLKEFPLKTAGSGPHGLTADKDGNIWYTGNSKALVGKLAACARLEMHRLDLHGQSLFSGCAHARPCASPASTCAMCSTRVDVSPVRRRRPSMFSMQPRSPSTTVSAPLALMFAHFSSTIAVEMSPYFTANVPPKPQQCSQPAISVTGTPACASSSRGCDFTPSSRKPEHES